MLRLFVKSDESVPKEVVANDADSKGEVTLEEGDLYDRFEFGERFFDEALAQSKKKFESIVGNQETIIENQQTTIKNQEKSGEVTLEEDDLYERCEAIGEQFLDEAFSQTKKKIESIVGNQETIIENQQTTIKNQEKSGEVTLEEGDLYERSMAFEFGEQFLDEACSQTKKQIERIVRNQETIIENQQTIIKNQEKLLGEVTLEEGNSYERWRCERFAFGEQFLDEALAQSKKKFESIAVGNRKPSSRTSRPSSKNTRR